MHLSVIPLKQNMKLFKDYGLSLALVILFLLSWIGQGYFQWKEFVSDQEFHNQEPQIDEFFDTFMYGGNA